MRVRVRVRLRERRQEEKYSCGDLQQLRAVAQELERKCQGYHRSEATLLRDSMGDTIVDTSRCGSGMTIAECEALYKRKWWHLVSRLTQLGSIVTKKITAVNRNGKERLRGTEMTREKMRTCLSGSHQHTTRTGRENTKMRDEAKLAVGKTVVVTPAQTGQTQELVAHTTWRWPSWWNEQLLIEGKVKNWQNWWKSQDQEESERWSQTSNPDRKRKQKPEKSSARNDSEARSRERGDKNKLTASEATVREREISIRN